MAVDTIFIGITICGTENVPVPDSAQGSEFLGINRCGGDPSPTPSQSPDGTCDFVFVIEDAPIIVSPSPSPTPSITPTPSNLGVAYSFLGFAWDSGSLCDKNTVFNAFAHASQVTGGSCNIIPLNFYTDINLSIPFDGGYKWFKVPCAVAGDYRNLIFSISSQGERGDIMEIQCVPYPSPSPTSSTTPSVTPTNSPSQTPDATCDFMFVIEDVPTTASPSPTQSPIPSPSPTPSNTPSPTPSSSSNSMLAVPIYNISNVPEGSTICSYNGILRTVYVRNQNDKDSIQNLELNPVGVAIWSDSAGTLSYGVMAPDFEAGAWSTSQAVAVGAIRRSISIDGNTGQISSVNDMNC